MVLNFYYGIQLSIIHVSKCCLMLVTFYPVCNRKSETGGHTFQEVSTCSTNTGLVYKHPDGRQEVRMFHVLRRNEVTLRPMIQRNVAPGTLIRSNEWAAYRNVALILVDRFKFSRH